MPDRNTDDQLVQRAGAGDSAAFLSLYERHRDAVYRFAYRLSGSVEGAEDITHDCFLSLIKRPDAFDSSRASLRTYLIAAARNLWLKRLRTISRESGIDELLDTQFVRDDKEPLNRMLEDELANRVQQAVSTLPPLQKEALVLFEYEGMSLNEIASLIGTDVGAVKSRLHRARQSLRSELRPYMNRNPELNRDREIVTLEKA